MNPRRAGGPYSPTWLVPPQARSRLATAPDLSLRRWSLSLLRAVGLERCYQILELPAPVELVDKHPE